MLFLLVWRLFLVLDVSLVSKLLCKCGVDCNAVPDAVYGQKTP